MMSAVIFDFNGTMVFDSPYHDLAWKVFSKQIRGYAMDDEEIKTNVHGKVNDKIIQYLKPELNADERAKLSLEKEAAYRKLALEDKENYRLVPGLSSFLDELKAKDIKRNIASASIKENIDFFIDTFELTNWFDIDNITYDDGSYMNKVAMFKDAAKRMNVEVSDCIIFEDSVSGINCAKEVKAKKIVVIAPKEQWQQYLDDPQIDLVIEDFTDERLKKLF